MRSAHRPVLFVLACTVAALLTPGAVADPSHEVRLSLTQAGELGVWDGEVERMLARGALALRRTTPDTLLAGSEHERFQQLHHGVPVFGGELVRQRQSGRATSLFATLFRGIDVDPTPRLSPEAARAVVERVAGVELGPARKPELFVLPQDDGAYVLAWRLTAFTQGDLRVYFVDAHTGGVALEYSQLRHAGVAGLGTGVLDDQKKMSVESVGGGFRAVDLLRPPEIATVDAKGDLIKVIRFLNGQAPLLATDLAQDSDNVWTDGAVVDAHTYAGWTYDYYFERFGRRGLDNRDISILSIVHPVRREDVFSHPSSIVNAFYLNAFYFGDGIMVYGEGLPPGVTAGGQRWNYLAGALDVVAHELTHGVTEFTSNLIYRNESGALNEAFSDFMAAGVEFRASARGDTALPADYLIGEDVVTPGGIRSMQNPVAYGDPDHYSVRFTGPEDNGGVHINSGIPNHAFYLAVEGGRNRVSGLSVQGVGGSNRDQIEKVFYRAFTQMLPASASFATARVATIQSARDLYGAGSPAERAVTQAWAAVGVN